MFKLRRNQSDGSDDLSLSHLFDQGSFYKVFVEDLKKAKSRVIIETPFITLRRVNSLLPVFQSMRRRSVRLIVNTKPLNEQEIEYRSQARQGIAALQQLGATILLTGGHHRKLAIVDNQILWEGSLNILSQSDSCEIMRRMYSEQLVNQMLAFVRLEKFMS